MPKENIYQSVQVFYEKVDNCPLRDREFNFFELVYVISGCGVHVVNGNKITYRTGDMFLLAPHDRHEFDLEITCEFMVIRFGESYIKEYQWKSMDHMECILYYASHLSGSVLINREDQQMVSSLMQNLRQAISYEFMYNEDLIRHLVNAIIVIAGRNIAIMKPSGITVRSDGRILQILDYIQEYIREPELLKVTVIADKFGISPTYLGTYFRKQCNETIQSYISSYRIRLIAHRLRFSNKRVHELADEFGFADESHINKFFKRHKGVSLKVFRDTAHLNVSEDA
ncbi:AraC family transcriptional regulator [Sphingobacterium zeae]|uniref:AraC-like DNA-binding protein n=1 Tax=Sphingobacterium zeae TaxID=1776859 RepID=A0ABU0U711_9SPHI|nr:AraC family transcriptional regulator [Sphingobacterium zeae]MDQ1150752.1 AraC-like DNA-binding protein [Sphingobacterium zeae]